MRFENFIHTPGLSGSTFIFLVCAGIMAAGLTACDRSPDPEVAKQLQPSLPVVVMQVELTDTDIHRKYPARIHGARQVQVRSRVGGILEKRLYEEGQMVAKDHLLFEIDPEPYEIALRRAEAEYDDTRAQYRHAEKQFIRYASLYEQDAISEREHELAETNYLLARARMDRTDAARADALRNLRYTRVIAPVSGVTDLESISEGNLIEAGQLLTTITQLDPVHVRFAIPENDALIQRAARATLSADSGHDGHYEAVLIMSDGTEYERTGDIDFTASTINPATGSMIARAVFPNPDRFLVPGQFVRVRIHLLELTDVVLIPEWAVVRGHGGSRVFVVDSDNIARARQVKTGPVIKDGQVILKGLDKGDKLVINGHVVLQDNMPVSVSYAGSGPGADPAEGFAGGRSR